MPKGFIMIRKKVGDDEKVLLADLMTLLESIMKSEEPCVSHFFEKDSNHDGPLGTIFPDTKYK